MKIEKPKVIGPMIVVKEKSGEWLAFNWVAIESVWPYVFSASNDENHKNRMATGCAIGIKDRREGEAFLHTFDDILKAIDAASRNGIEKAIRGVEESIELYRCGVYQA